IPLNHPERAKPRIRNDITSVRQYLDIFREQKRDAVESHRSFERAIESSFRRVVLIVVVIEPRNCQRCRARKSAGVEHDQVALTWQTHLERKKKAARRRR